MNKKNVLILAKYFPPNCGQIGWMIRIVEMANFLANEGYDVSVITADRKVKYENLLELDDRVNVKLVRSYRNYFSGYNPESRIQKFILRVFNAVNRRIHFFLERFFKIDITEDQKIAKESIFIIKEKKIKNVLITVPSYTVIKAGIVIKDALGDNVQVILDYRDPWTTHTTRKKKAEKSKVKDGVYFKKFQTEKKLKQRHSINLISLPLRRMNRRTCIWKSLVKKNITLLRMASYNDIAKTMTYLIMNLAEWLMNIKRRVIW